MALLAWAAIAGLVARATHFFRDRPLWYDEAALAINIVERSYIELLEPLRWAQSAPPLFLILAKLLAELFGPGEQTLRAISFLCGIALMPVTYVVARRIAGSQVAAVAAALVALSPVVVSYSAELKPYTSDALVSGVLLLATTGAQPGLSLPRLLTLGAGGFLAILMSTPAICTLGGIAAVWAWESRRQVRTLGRVAVLAGFWCVSFLIVAFLVHGSVASPSADIGRFMQAYWDPFFLDVPVRELPARAAQIFYGLVPQMLFGDLAPNGAMMTTGLLIVAGTAALIVQRRRSSLLLLSAPIALLAIAARLSLYPMAPRLSLFTVIPIAILLATGIWGTTPRSSRAGLVALRLGVTTLVIVLMTRSLIIDVRLAPRTEASRDFIASLMTDASDATPVWISFGAGPAWEFYSRVMRPLDARPPSAAEVLRAVGTEGFRSLPPPDQQRRFREWGDIEVARLQATGASCARLLLWHTTPEEYDGIRSAVERAGGSTPSTQESRGAYLIRACFPRAGER
ncbi:MAG: glycosyltransferase family 39 protein [Gemmatimonadaceae bacterium]|nr:glycosyltransferase family 39 protein [Gemmatimonadaceae bacterium]